MFQLALDADKEFCHFGQYNLLQSCIVATSRNMERKMIVNCFAESFNTSINIQGHF